MSATEIHTILGNGLDPETGEYEHAPDMPDEPEAAACAAKRAQELEGENCTTCGKRFSDIPGENSRAEVGGPPVCEACYGVEL